MSLYSDLNTYTPTDKSLVTDLASINQSIDFILSTRKGERLFNLDFGIDIEDYLFDLMDDLSVMQALDSVVQSVETYEPRVTINYNETTIKPLYDENKIDLTLVFTINDLGDQKFSVNKQI